MTETYRADWGGHREGSREDCGEVEEWGWIINFVPTSACELD